MMNRVSKNSRGFRGKIVIPSDKSISHRALMFGAIAQGRTEIEGLLESEDVLRTATALQAFGVEITKKDKGHWFVDGISCFRQPDHVLDMGNAGTAVRLLMGLVSSLPLKASFTGDASLCKRPMKRVIDPLSGTGAVFESTSGCLPLTVIGSSDPRPITYTLPVASAQVKSAILLSGLNIKGQTTVFEPILCRDHTERMLKAFGADLTVEPFETGHKITLKGKSCLKSTKVIVPSDISSAAFAIVGALITPNSEIILENIGVNPCRAGIIDVLQQMGGQITLKNERIVAGEPVADLYVCSSDLKGIDVPASLSPSMIDEYPILSVACACAKGVSRFRGLEELKVKESNRFEAILKGLRQNGIEIKAQNDNDLVITGGKPLGNVMINANLDHRIAMSFMIMGMVSQEPIYIDDITSVATSFPNFVGVMNEKGANIE